VGGIDWCSRDKPWRRFGGVALTAVLAGFVDVVSDTSMRISNPPALFMPAIVWTGFSGGLTPSLLSAAVSWAYTAYFFWDPSQPVLFSADDLRRVVVWAMAMPVTALLVGVLHQRAATAAAAAEVAVLREAHLRERADVAEVLRESERRLTEAERLAHVGWSEIDFPGGRLTASREAWRIFGEVCPNEAGTDDWVKWADRWPMHVHPDDRARVVQAVHAAFSGGPRFEQEYRVLRPGGEVRVIHVETDATLGDDGRPRRSFSVIRDITDLRRAEDDLRASEARFRTFVDHATDAFFLQDESGTIRDVNLQACRSLGYTREELIGTSPAVFDASFDDAAINDFSERLKTGELIAFDTRHRRKDGTQFPVEVRVRSFVMGGRRHGVSLARDVTERRRAEQTLRDSHGLLHAVIEGTPDAVFVKDVAGRYLMINTAGARFIGKDVDQITGRCDRDLFDAETAGRITERDAQVIAAGKPQVLEETVTGTGVGVTRTVLSTKSPFRDAQGTVVGLIGISRDITELKRLEEQFYQAQKMEAVGCLAGGIAHDFNNLLTVINACSDLAYDNLRPGDPNRELLADIQQAGDRAATLTRQLLAFSRRQVLQPQAVDVNALLAELSNLLTRLIGENIELTFDPRAQLSALVDRAQFEQAIVNLAVNARDAMPTGGQLHIETRESNEEEARAAHIPDGRYVIVTVTDSGEGMDEATLSRIFEPFFTTKPLGKGTGLGLAMVYGFVRQSGGHIDVDTKLGTGTTFQLYLPLAEPAGAAGSVRLDSKASSPAGTETVLLVEDEDAVRSLSRRILQARGYTVLEARNGQEGLSIARQYSGQIHLLITDVIMPHMNGRQLAEELAPIRPELKMLFMSGYTDETLEFETDRSFLQKPFTPLGLARKVRELLDDERA
jgi:two-component system cell cycle sensor histidine kinase/response regulator CckA